MRLPWLDPRDDGQPFPPADCALTEPDGLLAAGGNLSPRRLLRAYRQGIFPWYSARLSAGYFPLVFRRPADPVVVTGPPADTVP